MQVRGNSKNKSNIYTFQNKLDTTKDNIKNKINLGKIDDAVDCAVKFIKSEAQTSREKTELQNEFRKICYNDVFMDKLANSEELQCFNPDDNYTLFNYNTEASITSYSPLPATPMERNNINNNTLNLSSCNNSTHNTEYAGPADLRTPEQKFAVRSNMYSTSFAMARRQNYTCTTTSSTNSGSNHHPITLNVHELPRQEVFVETPQVGEIDNNMDCRFNPDIHHPNVGMVESKRGLGTCVLLNNGKILTNLHNIFDVKRYTLHVKEYHEYKNSLPGQTRRNQLMQNYHQVQIERIWGQPNKFEVTQSENIEQLKQRLPFINMDNPVDQYFDDYIIFSFFDNNTKRVRSFMLSIMRESVHNYKHITGLPLLQNNNTLGRVNWDFAILDVKGQLDNLNFILNTGGFELPNHSNSRPAFQEHQNVMCSQYVAPYFDNLPTASRGISTYNENEMNSHEQTKAWNHDFDNLPGASGSIAVLSNCNVIYSLIDTRTSGIPATEIVRNINYNLCNYRGDNYDATSRSQKYSYDPSGYLNCHPSMLQVLEMDPLVMKKVIKTFTHNGEVYYLHTDNHGNKHTEFSKIMSEDSKKKMTSNEFKNKHFKKPATFNLDYKENYEKLLRKVIKYVVKRGIEGNNIVEMSHIVGWDQGQVTKCIELYYGGKYGSHIRPKLG